MRVFVCRLEIVVTLAMVGACGTRARSEPELALDLVASVLADHDLPHELASAGDNPSARVRIATRLIRQARTEDRLLAATGNTRLHVALPEPGYACLEQGTCFSHYLVDQQHARDRVYGTDVVDPLLVERLAARLDPRSALFVEATRGEAAFIRGLRRTEVRFRGPTTAERLWLWSTGHSEEPARDRALAAILEHAPDLVQVATVRADEQPALARLVGARLTAACVFKGQIWKDVTTAAQWAEILGLEQPAAPIAWAVPHPIDAHIHVGANGEPILARTVTQGGIESTVIAALPDDVLYQGRDAANRRILALARSEPDRYVPLVLLDPEAPNPADELEGHLRAGARGIKLMSGHGGYFAVHPVELDSEPMREVLRRCEARGIPILWHVNDHLYRRGFLRVLAAFPKLRVVVPHFGGYLTFAPTIVRQLLERYPNLTFDISLGGQSAYVRRSLDDLSFHRDAWRALILDYPDRFLFGADLVVTPGTSSAHARMVYQLYRDLLERESYDLVWFGPGPGSLSIDEGHYRRGLRGLALPLDVLRSIYRDNAKRIYGIR